jgi:CBS domain containing-hemolysin-like protein
MSELRRKVVIFKKMLSIFLIAAIFFNGFIPKSMELKRNIIAAAKCAIVTHTNFYDKYAGTVVTVTNGIAKDILKVLNKEVVFEEEKSKANQAQEQDKEKSEPLNTSADNCIITGNNTNNQNEINKLKAKTANTMCIEVEEFSIVYSNLKLSKENLTKNIGILFFILFSILVVRIKETIAVINNNKNIVKEPTWLK